MKKILTVCAAASFAALSAGLPVRVDLNGRQDGVKLEKYAASENMLPGYAAYLKNDKECLLIVNSKRGVGKNYTQYEISFVPGDSGTVMLTFKSASTRKKSDARVLIDNVKVSGASLLNPSFEELDNGSPAAWHGNALLRTAGAGDGKNCISVTHKENIAQKLYVSGGKKVCISFIAAEDNTAK